MELEFKINIQNPIVMSLLIPVGFFISICPINVLGQHYQDEEKKIKYLNFSFHGNKVYNNRQIRELLNLPKSVKNSNQNDNLGQTKIQFENNLQKLLSAYQSEGFLAAKVDSIFWPGKSKKRQTVEIYFSEGEPFTINQLLIIGNSAFSKQQIKQFMRASPGVIFKSQQLAVDVQEIIARYAAEGYLLVNVEIQKIDIRFQDGVVDILLVIKEGKPIVLKRIEITGNTNTQSKVILRELGFNKNEILTSRKISKISEKIKRLKYLELTEQPKLTFSPDSSAILLLSVREKNSSQFDGILGFNPKQGNQNEYLSGQVKINFENLLGTGRSFRAYWAKQNANTQSLQLNYEEPWLGGQPIHGRINLEQTVQDTTFVRRNWQMGLRVFVLEDIAVVAQIGRESVLPDSIGRAVYQLPRSLADRLRLQVSMDNRNHPWNPTAGLLYETSVDFLKKRIEPLIPGESGQKINFHRLSFDLEFYQKLFGRNVLMAGFHGKLVKMNGFSIPIDELFRLGGASDLRGYRDDQFMGEKIAWANLEYRLLLDRTSRLTMFLDLGYIERGNNSGTLDKIYKSGYGFGLWTQTDLGIIGFDFALGEGDSFSQGKVHIRLINVF